MSSFEFGQRVLTVSILGKHFSRRHFKIKFLIFPRKQSLIFHANCLLRREYAGIVKPYFMRKNNKENIINLSSAEFDKKMLMVSMLDENFSRWTKIFSYLSQKKEICRARRQFTWKVKHYFQRQIRNNIISLSSAKFVQRVLKISKLGKRLIRRHLKIFRLSFPENGICYFLQTVS